MNGGEIVARVLAGHGVPVLFTLCGGHISPILVAAKRRGIRIVDVRHEANAVFAADATARLTGVPGVAAVTAGPGVTNTITAVKNAQLAQSPVVLLGGAAPTLLKGRGALQDIDQLALFEPHVKSATSVRRLRELAPALNNAFRVAQDGVRGPVFVECPVDLLYDEQVVRQWYRTGSGDPSKATLADRVVRWYAGRHVERLFAGRRDVDGSRPATPRAPEPDRHTLRRAAACLERAERPILLVGSQALARAGRAMELAETVTRLGLPVYLTGMARGLLGPRDPLQLRHRRRQALREADLVVLAGVPCDFRLDYGRQIPRRAVLLSLNLSRTELVKNRRPTVGILGDPQASLAGLAAESSTDPARWTGWVERLRERDREREREIRQLGERKTEFINPLRLCRGIDSALDDDSILVVDGGDFVATASYIVSPRGALSWLDPGVFGTLGIGAGFAMAAKLCRPDAEVWILYGDGSVAYSLAEFDTFVRHRLPVVAVVGNDAGWTQIAREQVQLLKDDVGTMLLRSDYHRVAEGYGGAGFLLDNDSEIDGVLQRAKATARTGSPVLVNALIGKTDFRKGSISM